MDNKKFFENLLPTLTRSDSDLSLDDRIDGFKFMMEWVGDTYKTFDETPGIVTSLQNIF